MSYLTIYTPPKRLVSGQQYLLNRAMFNILDVEQQVVEIIELVASMGIVQSFNEACLLTVDKVQEMRRSLSTSDNCQTVGLENLEWMLQCDRVQAELTGVSQRLSQKQMLACRKKFYEIRAKYRQ